MERFTFEQADAERIANTVRTVENNPQSLLSVPSRVVPSVSPTFNVLVTSTTKGAYGYPAKVQYTADGATYNDGPVVWFSDPNGGTPTAQRYLCSLVNVAADGKAIYQATVPPPATTYAPVFKQSSQLASNYSVTLDGAYHDIGVSLTLNSVTNLAIVQTNVQANIQLSTTYSGGQVLAELYDNNAGGEYAGLTLYYDIPSTARGTTIPVSAPLVAIITGGGSVSYDMRIRAKAIGYTGIAALTISAGAQIFAAQF